MLKEHRKKFLVGVFTVVLGILGAIFHTDLTPLAPEFADKVEMRIEAHAHVQLDDAH